MAAGDLTQQVGSSGAITITLAPGGTGLASSATVGRESAAIDWSANKRLDALVGGKIKLQTGTPANDKAVYVYVYGSEDGTNYTDNASGSDASITLRNPTNLKLAQVIACPDSGGLTYKMHPFSVAQFFGGVMPRKWGIVVRNYTGVSFSNTEGDHAFTYTEIYANAAAA